jgi:ATP-dependent DNA helicase MPH1
MFKYGLLDEAHRGTGDYAYAQVVRFMMAKNPHFRILALTATPGGTPDAVQSIVDSLHISRIEIRDETSLDLKEYIYKKVTTIENWELKGLIFHYRPLSST